MKLRVFVLIMLTVFFALMFAPAACWHSVLKHVSDDKLGLAATRGTIWHGQGTLVFKAHEDAAWRSATSLEWQILWSPLWQGQLVVDFAEQGTLMLAPGQAVMTNTNLVVPFELLQTFAPAPFNQKGWQGYTWLTGESLNCSYEGLCAGLIQIDLNQLYSPLIIESDLGSYQIAIDLGSSKNTFDIQTLKGPLQLVGQGEVVLGRPKGTLYAAVAEGPYKLRMDGILGSFGEREGKRFRMNLE